MTIQKHDCAADPFQQFQRWRQQAEAAGVLWEDAAALATVDANGQPAIRMVLIKAYEANGFYFLLIIKAAKVWH